MSLEISGQMGEMPVSSLDPSTLYRMVDNEAVSDEKKMKVMSQQFEGLLIKPLVKAAFESQSDSSMAKGVKNLATELLVDSIAKAEPFGISTVFQSQFNTKQN